MFLEVEPSPLGAKRVSKDLAKYGGVPVNNTRWKACLLVCHLR